MNIKSYFPSFLKSVYFITLICNSLYCNEIVKTDSYQLENITELASYYNISLENISDASLPQIHYFKRKDDIRFNAFYIRLHNNPAHDVLFDIYNNNNVKIAYGHGRELPSKKSAQFCLLADLSETSMPLFLIAQSFKAIGNIGDYCICNNKKNITILLFTRNGVFIKLEALTDNVNLTEIAKKIDENLIQTFKANESKNNK